MYEFEPQPLYHTNKQTHTHTHIHYPLLNEINSKGHVHGSLLIRWRRQLKYVCVYIYILPKNYKRKMTMSVSNILSVTHISPHYFLYWLKFI